MLDLFDLPDELRDELAPFQPDFKHQLLDLSQVEVDDIGGEIVVRTMLTLLKAAAAGEIERWLDEHGELLLELLKQPDAHGILNSFLRYICRAGGGIRFSTVKEKLARLHSPQMNTELMTIEDELMQKGHEPGFAKGRTEGRAQGRTEGRTEGIERGLMIGRIQLLEEMLGETASRRELLADIAEAELWAMEAGLRRRMSGS